MKKILITLVAALIIGSIAGLSYGTHIDSQEQLINQQETDSLSVLYNRLGLKNMKVEKSTMIVYFNSGCQHCQTEIEDISSNGNLFMTTQMVFVSSEPESQAVEFLSKYNLEVLYAKTESENIYSTFSGGVPQIFIYENEQLKQHFLGRTDVEILASYLK